MQNIVAKREMASSPFLTLPKTKGYQSGGASSYESFKSSVICLVSWTGLIYGLKYLGFMHGWLSPSRLCARANKWKLMS